VTSPTRLALCPERAAVTVAASPADSVLAGSCASSEE